jgi:hypothetical protein
MQDVTWLHAISITQSLLTQIMAPPVGASPSPLDAQPARHVTAVATSTIDVSI